MTDPFRNVSPRVFALLAFLCFVPVVISFAVAPDAWWWRNYPGILFHLAIFLLVAKLEAPDWAKAAGYGWLVIDVMVGIATLNGVPIEIYFPLRLGGHVFGGIWIVTASLSGSRLVQIIGIIAGVWLGGYSFVAPFVSPKVLGPNSILILVWLLIIAWQNGTKSRSQATYNIVPQAT